jgi:hypothetical protein
MKLIFKHYLVVLFVDNFSLLIKNSFAIHYNAPSIIFQVSQMVSNYMRKISKISGPKEI